jgi:hypothetical protein
LDLEGLYTSYVKSIMREVVTDVSDIQSAFGALYMAPILLIIQRS